MLTVLGEDHRFLYLLKPAGVTVFPLRKGEGPRSLLERLVLAHGPSTDWPEGFEGGLLHRLDRWTSGLVIAARSLDALVDGRAAFASHRLRKRYVFLSDGVVPWRHHIVQHALAHHPRDRRRMVWRRGRSTAHRGKWYAAETQLRHLGGPRWEAVMGTGVMHQIRVHAASAGLPLRGDCLYGGGSPDDGRFFLHHHRIDGWLEPCPEAPLPADWPGPPPPPVEVRPDPREDLP